MRDIVLKGYLRRADEWETQGAKYAAAIVRDLVAEVRRLKALGGSAGAILEFEAGGHGWWTELID